MKIDDGQSFHQEINFRIRSMKPIGFIGLGSMNKKSSDGIQSKFPILLIASFVSSLSALDMNIVGVSLPPIARSLNASFADIEWVVSAYILPFAALLLASGSFADRHGRKRLMLIGLFVFTAASALCGLSTSALMLNLSRALQGIGASLTLPAALAVINHAFPGVERAKAYAFWGACLGVAITTGPIIGGLITTFFGWRWVFLINLPVCAALVIATLRAIKESRDQEAKGLDLAGIVTFTSGLFFLIWALIDANALGWTTMAILGRLATAACLLGLFVVAEVRQQRPMVDFSLFRRATFLGSTFAMLGYAGAAQVMIFYLPLCLQNAYEFDPAWAGAAMLPFALPMFLTPRLVGAKLASHYSGRTLLTAGLLITLAGNLLLSACAAAALGYGAFLIGMIVAGTGAGLLNGETVKVMQGAAPPQRGGMVSGVIATVRFTGLLIFVAGLGSVLSHVAVRGFAPAAARLGLGQDLAQSLARRIITGDLIGALSQAPIGIRSELQVVGTAVFSDGFAAASLAAAAVAMVCAILTLVLVRSSETQAIHSIASAME
jgi:EmrB/QacA subfamily drug resistance transporter